MHRARHRLFAVLQPFWELLSAYTGYTAFTLLAGAPPKDEDSEYKVAAIRYGKTSEPCPRDFFKFDPDAFKTQVFGLFTKFLRTTKSNSIDL